MGHILYPAFRGLLSLSLDMGGIASGESIIVTSSNAELSPSDGGTKVDTTVD